MSVVPYHIERSTRAGRIGFAIMLVVVVGVVSLPAWAGRAEMRLLIEFSYYLALAQAWNLLEVMPRSFRWDSRPSSASAATPSWLLLPFSEYLR